MYCIDKYTKSQQTQNICITFVQRRHQRLRRWSNIVQMSYKYFVFAGVTYNVCILKLLNVVSIYMI